jgi:CRISPR-associated protein Csb2
MSAFGTPPSATLAGKDEAGSKLLGHRHAHYLACDLDGDRILDHAIVWAPTGFEPDEVRALTQMERLSTRQPVEGLRPLRLALEALGDPAATIPELVGPAARWVSHTPFAPPRHRKRHQTDQAFVAGEVERELRSRQLPAARVEFVAGDWLKFRRRRLNERLGEDQRALGIRLRFDRLVRGPLALGSLSHFGLGVFMPQH